MVDKELGNLYDPSLNVGWSVWPIPLQVDFEDAVMRAFEAIDEAWTSKNPEGLGVEYKSWYDSFLEENANPRQDVASWSTWAARYLGQRAVYDNNSIVNFANMGFPGQTETMETKWVNLEKLENETILKIILGEQPIDYFDTFVEQWKRQGGDEITKEVNELLN